MLAKSSGLVLLALVSSTVAKHCTLNDFNATVAGRLQLLTPFSLPCFSNYNGKPVARDNTACATIQANYSDPLMRTNSPNGYMNNQDEMWASDPSDQCLLDSSDPTDPLAFVNTTCRQGNLPSHYLEVQSAKDVIEAFKFSNCSGKKLVIKNSGHDYLTRSSGRDTLSLWTRNLQSMQYSADFAPRGSKNTSRRYQAITVGAGVNFDEVYEFAQTKNVTILGGYSPTVGVSGGWIQNGGHSILSPVYGLGVDRVLEFKIVTPDGVYRTANEFQNRDLFWALRGGGGGTFGVVLESTHHVEPAIRFVAANIKFTSNSTNMLPFMEIVVNNTLKWGQEGWGGHITGNTLVNISPFLSVEEAEVSLASVIAYAKANGGSATIEEFTSWYPFYEKYVKTSSVAVGVTRFPGSRLIPRSIFNTVEGRQNLMDYFAVIQSLGQTPYIPVVGPVLYNYTEGSTSASPAWREAIWELGSGATWDWNATLPTRKQKIQSIQNMTAIIEGITPGSGAYSNEANPFTIDWIEAWWGDNYAKLLKIKNKYDPRGLLNCWKCIGWKESQVADSPFAALL
ncbi:CAZyme family AA7 [Penicillium psychrosexuale]|uniref:CAZyme family AA7 n=1 Tax=Penicillium psychrosexuale TaxID=1002107 RepID=UPI00254510EF|nr:CAZyme family AA7 [Penicillium psychrosexuale]KAJ5800175.1 CAZyme family AA7 [Penicillium psychrosexuale]